MPKNKEDQCMIYTSLAENLQEVTGKFGNSPDVIIRKFTIIQTQIKVAAIYIDGLVDKVMVDEFISHAMSLNTLAEGQQKVSSGPDAFNYIKEKALSIGEEKIIKDWKVLFAALLSGETVILIDDSVEAISGNTSGGEVRAVSEATTQVAIRGSKESFTEAIGTNLSLVRRRIKSSNLWVESFKIGEVTQTDVSIMYINGIANDKSIKQLRTNLKDTKIDALLESGYIEQLIEEKIYSPFPTVFNTERPDSVAGNLLEGRIAIFVDGTPFVLIAPATFFLFFHSVDDYYQRFDISSLIRLLRFVCLFISLFGPAIFISLVNFHQEMIPTPLLINLASQREGVPFPAFIEAVMMEITFEIIREAGIRLPSQIGQTVSIIGGLVLGQAAVQAGIVSPAMVIVVSITGISSFATPSFNMALSIRLLRFLILFVSGFIGLYGIALIGIMLIGHMCSLRSLGVPYLSPAAPFIPEDQKDTIIRAPFQSMKTRPRLVSQKNKKRLEMNKKNGGSK
ncbi:spore germination protein [Paenibacillus wynnii]|uniref:Spore gernimation protein KB n=1 Tax=Paenibacillus wynnii TaxID=268407 RepID=A0A098M8Q3_9BACL|nr:spore gernimation protein KB [Paenibacillus wynnii]